MAVIVYDRENRQWPFESAVTASVDPNTSALLLRDDSAKIVGSFNCAAWTHWGLPLPAAS